MIKKKVNKKARIIKIVISLLILLFIGAYTFTIFNLNFFTRNYKPSDMTMRLGTVKDVISSDTLEVQIGDKVERVKLKGVAIPIEMKDQAMEYLKDELKGKVVELHYYEDQYHDDIIKYGRMAAYIYFKHVLMNGSLIEKGFAIALSANDLSDSPKARELFYKLENEARTKGVGIWERTRDKASIAIESNTKQAIDGLGKVLNNTTKDLSTKVAEGIKEGSKSGTESLKDIINNILDKK